MCPVASTSPSFASDVKVAEAMRAKNPTLMIGMVGARVAVEPQGSLDARVQTFADDKIKIDDSVSNLDLQFSKLASLRGDIEGVTSRLDRALDRLGRGIGKKRPPEGAAFSF